MLLHCDDDHNVVDDCYDEYGDSGDDDGIDDNCGGACDDDCGDNSDDVVVVVDDPNHDHEDTWAEKFI